MKPPNILFDAQGNAYLGDFGVAKFIAAMTEGPQRRMVTGTGMVLGTPGYMAPEAILGRAFDGRADQYGLAVTVYEALAGRRPFESATATAVLVQQTTVDPPSLLQYRPELPDAVGVAVGRALGREPQSRFADCAAFARAVVSAAASGQAPRAATPASPAPRRVATTAMAAGRNPIPCPICGVSANVSAEMRGKRLRCPSCATKLSVSDDLGSLTPVPGQGGTTTEMPSLAPVPVGAREGRGTARMAAPAGLESALPPRAPATRPVTRIEVDPTGLREEGPPARMPRNVVAVGGLAAVAAVVAILAWDRSSGERRPVPPEAAIAPRIEAKAVASRSPTPETKPPSTAEERFLEPARQAVREGRLGEALADLGRYLDQADAARREEAEDLRDEIRDAGDDSRARQILADLNDAEFASFAAGAGLPFEIEGSEASIVRARKATLQRNLPSARAARAAARRAGAVAAAAPKAVETPADRDVPLDVDFSEVRSDPEKFAGRVVHPTGLFWVGLRLRKVSDQITMPVADINGRVLADGTRLTGPSPAVVLDPQLASQLDTYLTRNPRDFRPESRYRAQLKLEIRKIDLGAGRDAWAAVITKMQILAVWDEYEIARRQFGQAFGVLEVSDSSARPAYGDGMDWAQRIGDDWISKIKRDLDKRARAARTNQGKANVQNLLNGMAAKTQQDMNQHAAAFRRRINAMQQGKF